MCTVLKYAAVALIKGGYVAASRMRIQCGFGDIFVAGGVESMTNAPYLVPSKVRNGVKMGDMKMVDSMLHDGLTDGMYGILTWVLPQII